MTSARPVRATSLAVRAATAAAILTLVLLVFGRTAHDDFVAFDDPAYVTDNAIVQRGLTAEGVRWAMTAVDPFYWHPLTWISHMTDSQMFGPDPGGRHVINVLIHAVTALLVFAAFGSLTGAWWRSAAVAAIFAVHPLNVEPVAWIAERKALLAGCFWFTTILAYVWYVRGPSVRRYAVVCASFALGLMSKPDVVTLPLVLVLLDAWPLGRLAAIGWRRSVAEKLPLAALSAVAGCLTYLGQRRAGAMVLLEHVTLADRARHAAIAYAIYVRQFLWPHPLAVLYPYPAHERAGAVVLSIALLTAITAASVRLVRRAPFLLVGCLWFVVALLPMIGFIQVGAQSHADRFMYIPAVGLMVAVVWGGAEIFARRRAAGVFAAAALIAASAIAASAQTRYWRTSVTLMSHSLAVTGDNALALHLLAFSLAKDGRVAEAVPVYRASLRLAPVNPLAWYNLGLAQASLHDMPDAAASFSNAVRQAPAYGEARCSLGAALVELRRFPEAQNELEAALRLPLDSDSAAYAAFDLGLIAAYQGDFARAKTEFGEALRRRPGFAEARINFEKASALLARR